MSDPNEAQKAKSAEGLPRARFLWGVRVSPHVIVFLLTLLAAIPPLKGAIISGIHWWWDKSYEQIQYVMDEARPNEGAPYIAGHLDGSTDQHNLVGQMRGTAMVVKALPEAAFAPGKRILLWHSADAPNFVVFGDEVNDMPVAALPQRPGLPAFLAYLAWLLGTSLVGFGAMVWVGNRWSRDYGELQMRYRPGSKL